MGLVTSIHTHPNSSRAYKHLMLSSSLGEELHHNYCTVLYCTVLYCTVLYCTVLYCTVLYSALLSIALFGCNAAYEHTTEGRGYANDNLVVSLFLIILFIRIITSHLSFFLLVVPFFFFFFLIISYCSSLSLIFS